MARQRSPGALLRIPSQLLRNESWVGGPAGQERSTKYLQIGVYSMYLITLEITYRTLRFVKQLRVRRVLPLQGTREKLHIEFTHGTSAHLEPTPFVTYSRARPRSPRLALRYRPRSLVGWLPLPLVEAVTWSAVVEYNHVIFHEPCAFISGSQVVVERCKRLRKFSWQRTASPRRPRPRRRGTGDRDFGACAAT